MIDILSNLGYFFLQSVLLIFMVMEKQELLRELRFEVARVVDTYSTKDIEEVNIIMDAQASRGVDFHSGSIFRRMGKVMPLVIPLFVSAIRRSADLAMAMEARGYSEASERTKYRPLRYTSKDRIAYVIAIVVFVLLILTRIIL